MFTHFLAPEPSIGWLIAEIAVLLIAAAEVLVTLVSVVPFLLVEARPWVHEPAAPKPAALAPGREAVDDDHGHARLASAAGRVSRGPSAARNDETAPPGLGLLTRHAPDG